MQSWLFMMVGLSVNDMPKVLTRIPRVMGWSMTKSITNALVGILVKEGRLDVNKSAPVAEWQEDDRNKITLNHLLQASSGLEWSESYFTPTRILSPDVHEE